MLGRFLPPKSCSGQGWSPQPCRDLKAEWLWHLGTQVGSALLGLDLMIPEGFSSLNNSPSVGVISTHGKIGVAVEVKATPSEAAAFTSTFVWWRGAQQPGFPKINPNTGRQNPCYSNHVWHHQALLGHITLLFSDFVKF